MNIRRLVTGCVFFMLMTEGKEAGDLFRILIDIGDKELEHKLSRRIAELSGNLEMICGRREDFTEADISIDKESLKDFFPVSRGISFIADSYSKKTGKPLYRPKSGFRKHYRFTSPTGGSGMSAIALVFSRLLAGKTGEKVLLIDIGRKDSFMYGESEGKPLKSIRELEFRADNGLEVVLKDHLTEDHYGIDILCTENISGKLMDILELKGDYDTIVIAGDHELFQEEMKITVINVKDSRTCDLLPENGIIVRNRDYINNVNEDRVLIAEDGLSFKNPSGKVVISMDGDFAYGVEKLMRKAVNDYEYV